MDVGLQKFVAEKDCTLLHEFNPKHQVSFLSCHGYASQAFKKSISLSPIRTNTI